MTALAELRDRVTDLEARVDEVEKLARGTDREVADWRDTLNNHMQTLNGMSDKIDLFQERVDDRLDRFEAKVDKGFAEAERTFTLLHQGQERITELLTRQLDEPDEETSAGGADE